MENEKIIEKLKNLYIIQCGRYLIQSKDGIYKTCIKGETKSNGKKRKALTDWHLEQHLEGEFTIGTFSKFFSKFITFDVDFHDPEMAKWITYKVADTLDNLGIEFYYISYSGSKGYHIDLFFEDLIQVDYAKKFFDYVILQSDVLQHSDLGNKVEFRVTEKQGVKLPLGYHQKTGNYCGFCKVETGLKVIGKKRSQEYLFSIKKMKHKAIMDIIGIESKTKHDKKLLIKTEDAISQHKPLENYEPNENYSIDLAIKMLQDGLQVQGSRNNSIFLIGLYFKYMGMDEPKCRDELYTWMEWQKPNTYTTPLTECYKDIDSTIKNMYLKNYNLTAKVKDLSVTFDEIKWIIDNCPEKNQKLIAYSMLIHSKRHANLQGVFFMTFKDMESVTGIRDQALQQQVNKLNDLNVIEVVARNQKQKGTCKKKSNLYRMNFVQELDKADSTKLDNEIYVTDKNNDFVGCIKFYFTDTELRKIFSQRQYKSLVG